MSEIIRRNGEGHDNNPKTSLKDVIHYLFKPLKGMRVIGMTALLFLTPQEYVTAKNSMEPFQSVLKNVIVHIKEGDTFIEFLKRNGIVEILKKHGLNTVESKQALTLLERYIDDLIKTGQMDKIHMGEQWNLSKLLFDTKVPYTDGDEEGKEHSSVVISAFTPKNANKYGMAQIASWPKSIAITESFMEFEDVMQAKQFASRMKARVMKKINEFAPDLSEAEKKGWVNSIISLALVSVSSEFYKIHKDTDAAAALLQDNPEKAIIGLISKYPGWSKELEKQVNKAISETFSQTK